MKTQRSLAATTRVSLGELPIEVSSKECEGGEKCAGAHARDDIVFRTFAAAAEPDQGSRTECAACTATG